MGTITTRMGLDSGAAFFYRQFPGRLPHKDETPVWTDLRKAQDWINDLCPGRYPCVESPLGMAGCVMFHLSPRVSVGASLFDAVGGILKPDAHGDWMWQTRIQINDQEILKLRDRLVNAMLDEGAPVRYRSNLSDIYGLGNFDYNGLDFWPETA